MERIDADWIQIYGQTECPNFISTLGKREHRGLVSPGATMAGSCGQPCAMVDVEIRSAGARLKAGEVGEVCVRSPYLMREHHGNEEATAAAVDEGWLRTGDAGYQDGDGFLYVVDRLKDMIITGGMNVYSTEVETVLQRFAGVCQVAVVGVPNKRWGEAVLEVVVPAANANVASARIIEFAKQSLVEYKVPKKVVLVDSIPTTAVGKPDKKALRSAYWPDGGRQIS